jgi:hypothetical protein
MDNRIVKTMAVFVTGFAAQAALAQPAAFAAFLAHDLYANPESRLSKAGRPESCLLVSTIKS